MSGQYSIVFSKLARERFDHFIRSDRKLGEQIARAVDRLAANPNLGKSLKGEWKGYQKYCTDRYRIIYRLEHSKLLIFIITIDDRKDVYK